MAKKQRKFVDDGWAIWTDGDDICTIYLHDWLNPKGKSYVDLAIRIRNVKVSTRMRVYVPFAVSREEIDDVSLLFNDTKILQAIFGSACVVDYKKNACTSEIAYFGKTVDIIHLSTLDYQLSPLSDGTLLDIDFASLQPHIVNDEAYLIWRMPHKSLDNVFGTYKSAGSFFARLRDRITTPIQSEKYGYSIRVNESRHLPPEINKLGAFHRQKLKKAVVTVSVSEDYEINDANCFQIRRLEESLYHDFVPNGFSCDGAISYQWKESAKEIGLRGKFNFYLNIKREVVSAASMVIYMILLVIMGGFGNFFADLTYWFVSLF